MPYTMVHFLIRQELRFRGGKVNAECLKVGLHLCVQVFYACCFQAAVLYAYVFFLLAYENKAMKTPMCPGERNKTIQFCSINRIKTIWKTNTNRWVCQSS